MHTLRINALYATLKSSHAYEVINYNRMNAVICKFRNQSFSVLIERSGYLQRAVPQEGWSVCKNAIGRRWGMGRRTGWAAETGEVDLMMMICAGCNHCK